MKEKIEILIPTFNEEKNIKEAILGLRNEGYYNIKILDARSTDNTVAVAKELGCNIRIDKKKNLGFGASVINGINDSKYEYCCIFDGDNSFDPKSINEMINEIRENDYDFIFCSRYLEGNKSDDDTIITKLGNYILTKLVSILFNFNSTDLLFLYVLGKTKKFKNLNLSSKDFRICPEILIKAFSFHDCKEIFSHEKRRLHGQSKVNKMVDGFLILTNILYNFVNIKIFRNKI